MTTITLTDVEMRLVWHLIDEAIDCHKKNAADFSVFKTIRIEEEILKKIESQMPELPNLDEK